MKSSVFIAIFVIISFTEASLGKKTTRNYKEKWDKHPEPKFSDLDDATKIQLEIERQSLTQTIDGLKKQLKTIENKEKKGSLDEASEDEKDRILEQLDSLYRQRNDLYERVQKKLDEQKKGKRKDHTERPNKSKKPDNSEKLGSKSPRNSKSHKSEEMPRSSKSPKFTDEV